ncbi:MAG: glycoside hydrolase family 38 C-terminal domain-containing protein [Bacteroidales bacterium]|jgi:alpha-mannosidase|nr:glycoside hydrolase family 38 C-terminal domain-containing protein [Bacteroidales bacterium]
MDGITRRDFLGKAAAGTAGIVIAPVLSGFTQTGKWPAEASKLRFHLIGHAHIDPVWLWPWQEGISVVHSTFRSALDRMNETPDFAFTSSSAQFYEWVAENDPGMLAEIRKRVGEGRWNVVGGWWVEPDMNIPGGEAMVRQGLYGQRTLEKLTGRRATVAFNPDSFGHTGTLPQIIKSQGMDNYVFMRPGPGEKEIPADMFWWEGPDGSKVLTYRIPISYNDSRSVRGRIEKVMEQFRDQPFRSFMSYYGAGDHGGGATKENIASIKEIQNESGAPVLIFSTPEKYFTEIRGDENLNLPVIKDDLQHHAVGCYTAETEIKKNNRLSEAALITAEKISALGSVIWNFKYPREEFTSAWKRVLFLQFHDSLAGTSVPEHSASAREGYGYALDVAHQAVYKAVQKLEWQIESKDPASQYMIAFNPHAWDIKGNIEYDFNWDLKTPSTAEDEKGNLLRHQWTAGTTETGSRKGIVVRTTIPALGYRQIRIRAGEPQDAMPGVNTAENSVENEFLKLTVRESGSIDLLDKENGIEVFRGISSGCRAIVIDDPSDTWSHDIKSFSKEIGSFGNTVVKIPESGPLRGILRSVSKYGDSTLTIDWILYAGARTVEAKVSLNWNEKLKMVKFSFPVNVDSPEATYETSYGFISRKANGDEDPGQRWIDVTGTGKGATYGLAVINDAKYGYSVKGNDMRISVIRSAVFAHHNPRVLEMDKEHIWQDQGIHSFRMLLVPHRGTWQENSVTRKAEEFLSPPIAIYQGIHGGSMPGAGSFVSVNDANIIVSSIKQAEEGEDLVVRCVETSGKSVTATVDFSFLNRRWTGTFRPCEIKSLRLDCKNRSVKEVNLLEEDIHIS